MAKKLADNNKPESADIHESASFIMRKRWGKGFQYFDTNNTKVNDKEQLKRIKSLAIPPMWEEVIIAVENTAKIQASGRDAKGRKQYIYSAQWQRQQQNEKFNKLMSFAEALPEMRQYCRQQLKEKSWQPEKVLALMVLVLDHTGIRIGNKRYSDTNHTYGLSTLRRKHIVDCDEGLTFEFVGKSGKERQVRIDDNLLAKHINDVSQRPGYNIFRYKESSNAWSDVSSDEVNEFIRAKMGQKFSCKDFRTWNGTCLAVEGYCNLFSDIVNEKSKPSTKKLSKTAKKGKPKNNNKPDKIINKVVKFVSKNLGNTPAVCREYYIHPLVLTKMGNQEVNVQDIHQFNKKDERNTHMSTKLSPIEIEVLSLLN